MTVTTRESAPRSSAIAVIPDAPPAIEENVAVERLTPWSSSSCPASAETTRVARLTRRIAGQSPGEGAQGIGVDLRGHDRSDGRLGDEERRTRHRDLGGREQGEAERAQESGEQWW